MKKSDVNKEILGVDYEFLLNRGVNKLPSKIKEKTKFEIPKVEIVQEAGRTIILNWKDITSAMNRDSKSLLKFLEHRLGTVGWERGGKGFFQGKFPRTRLNRLIEFFVNEYIICDVCKRPDTNLVKEKGVLIKKCDACGAWRVVERI